MKKQIKVTVTIVDPNDDPETVVMLLREIICDAVKLKIRQITPCE